MLQTDRNPNVRAITLHHLVPGLSLPPADADTECADARQNTKGQALGSAPSHVTQSTAFDSAIQARATPMMQALVDAEGLITRDPSCTVESVMAVAGHQDSHFQVGTVQLTVAAYTSECSAAVRAESSIQHVRGRQPHDSSIIEALGVMLACRRCWLTALGC